MEQELTIRLADARDTTLMATLARDLVEAGPDWSWTPSEIRRALQRPDTIAPVACFGHAKAGFALVHVGLDEAFLHLLAVRPGRRRQGIGRTLVQWLEQSMLVAGVGIVRVAVRPERPEVQAFFRHLGYRPSRTGIIQQPAGPIYMAHDLWCPPVMDEVP